MTEPLRTAISIPEKLPEDSASPALVESAAAFDSEWAGEKKKHIYFLIASEINAIARYAREIVQWQPRENDNGVLFGLLKASAKRICSTTAELGKGLKYSMVLLNGNINHDYDIQGTLSEIRQSLSRESRVLLVAYNPYIRWVYALANRFGLRKGAEPDTFVTETDLANIVSLSGYVVVRARPLVYVPFHWGGIGDFLNKFISVIPLVNRMSLAWLYVLRPVMPDQEKPSLTVVIPARNERGNIENALKRMPQFGGAKLEIIFVEGHSSDQTWEEIQRVATAYRDQYSIKVFQQTGKGKADAVRLGFKNASGDLLTILDADLTMPPELLERFYDAYVRGLADFINGSRLVYPMEGQAMRFLNRLGNVFFAKSLSYVLGTRIGDSLCGTKLVSRLDYDRMIAWRRDFGDFDPFGDFELLYPAAELGLGIVDVAIRYRDRVYGSTNIRRFYHGWQLLKMTSIGFFKMRLPKTKMLG